MTLAFAAYRDNTGSPVVLDAVIQAKSRLLESGKDWQHEYLPISGLPEFLVASQKLAFGEELAKEKALEGTLTSMQTLSGTGALHLAATLYSRFAKSPKVMVSNPTWGNHKALFSGAGLQVENYRYLDSSCASTPRLDLKGMLEDLEGCDAGTMVLLQVCAHNPTGVDPTEDEWKEVIKVCKSRGLIVLLDNAYQGFSSGDVGADNFAMKEFAKSGLDVFCACSFAKNMGLYGERIGALHVIAPNKEVCQNVLSQLKVIARTTYSNPPQFGALIVAMILNDEQLRATWEKQLRTMTGRIKSMREELRTRLESATSADWSHITSQIGMFSYTGLTKDQCIRCREKGALFMLETGRISVAGLNDGNVQRVAEVMAASVNDNDKDKVGAKL